MHLSQVWAIIYKLEAHLGNGQSGWAKSQISKNKVRSGWETRAKARWEYRMTFSV